MGNLLDTYQDPKVTPYIPDLREPNIEYNFSCDEDGQTLSNLWIDFEISQLESSEAEDEAKLHLFITKFISIYKDWTPSDCLTSSLDDSTYSVVHSRRESDNQEISLFTKMRHRVPRTSLSTPGHPMRLFKGIMDYLNTLPEHDELPSNIHELETFFEILTRSFHNRVLLNIYKFPQLFFKWIHILSEQATLYLSPTSTEDKSSFYSSLLTTITIYYHYTGKNQDYLLLPNPLSLSELHDFYLHSSTSPESEELAYYQFKEEVYQKSPLYTLFNSFQSFQVPTQDLNGALVLFDCIPEFISIIYKLVLFTTRLHEDQTQWYELSHYYLSVCTRAVHMLGSSCQDRIREEQQLNTIQDLLEKCKFVVPTSSTEVLDPHQVSVFMELLVFSKEILKCNQQNIDSLAALNHYSLLYDIYTSLIQYIYTKEAPLLYELDSTQKEPLEISMTVSDQYYFQPKGLSSLEPHMNLDLHYETISNGPYGVHYAHQFVSKGSDFVYLDILMRLLTTSILEINSNNSIFINNKAFLTLLDLFHIKNYMNSFSNASFTSSLSCYLLHLLMNMTSIAPDLYDSVRQAHLLSHLLADSFLPLIENQLFKIRVEAGDPQISRHTLYIEDSPEKMQLYSLFLYHRELVFTFILKMVLYSCSQINTFHTADVVQNGLNDLHELIQCLTSQQDALTVIQCCSILSAHLLKDFTLSQLLRYSPLVPTLFVTIHHYTELYNKVKTQGPTTMIEDPSSLFLWPTLSSLLTLLDLYLSSMNLLVSTCVTPYLPLDLAIQESSKTVYTNNDINYIFHLLDLPETSTFALFLISHLLRLSTMEEHCPADHRGDSMQVINLLYIQFGLSLSRIRSLKTESSDTIILSLLDLIIYILSENDSLLAKRQKAFADSNLFVHLLSIISSSANSSQCSVIIYKTLYIIGFMLKKNNETKELFKTIYGYQQFLDVLTSLKIQVTPTILQFLLFIACDKINDLSYEMIIENNIMEIPEAEEKDKKQFIHDFVPALQETEPTAPASLDQPTETDADHIHYVESVTNHIDLLYLQELVIQFTDILYVYLYLLVHAEASLQRNGLFIIKYILSGNHSTLNLTNVTTSIKPSLMEILLDIISQVQMENSLLILQLIQICSVHYISVEQLKKVFSLLHTNTDYRPYYSTHILYMFTQLFLLTNNHGPENFFLFSNYTSGLHCKSLYNGPQGSTTLVSGLPKFPSTGHTISIWFNLKKYVAPWCHSTDEYKPVLFAFLDSQVSGIILSIHKNTLVLQLKNKGVDLPLPPVQYNLQEDTWYHVICTHNSSRFFSSKSSIQLYVNGTSIYKEPLVYPTLVDCKYAMIGTLGDSIPTLNNTLQNTTFNGYIGSCYLLGKSVTDQQARGLYLLGPDYTYNFEAFASDKRIYNQQQQNREFYESVLDGSLRDVLLFNANPSVLSDEKEYITDITPPSSRTSKWGTTLPTFNSVHIYLSPETYQCMTKRLHTMLDCIGGINCMFPLVSQFDLKVYATEKSDYVEGTSFSEQFFKMLSASLINNPINQQVVIKSKSMTILGYLLNRCSPENITIPVYSEIFHLLQVGLLPEELQDSICETFILSPTHYIYTPFKVQEYIWKSIVDYCHIKNHVIKKHINLSKLFIFLKYYYSNVNYSLPTDTEEVKDALHDWLCTNPTRTHPYTNEPRGQKLSVEENTIIRTYIYSIMKQLLNEQVLSKTDCYGIAQTLLWGRKQQDYLLVQELLDILSDYFTDAKKTAHFIEQLYDFSHVGFSKATNQNGDLNLLYHSVNRNSTVPKRPSSYSFKATPSAPLRPPVKLSTVFSVSETTAPTEEPKATETLLPTEEVLKVEEPVASEEPALGPETLQALADPGEETPRGLSEPSTLSSMSLVTGEKRSENITASSMEKEKLTSVSLFAPSTTNLLSSETLSSASINVEKQSSASFSTEPHHIKSGVLPLFFALLLLKKKEIHIQLINIFSKIFGYVYASKPLESSPLLKSLCIIPEDIVPICLFIQDMIKDMIDQDITEAIYQAMMTGANPAPSQSLYDHKIVLPCFIFVYLRSLKALSGPVLVDSVHQFTQLFVTDKASAYNYTLLFSLPCWQELLISLLLADSERLNPLSEASSSVTPSSIWPSVKEVFTHSILYLVENHSNKNELGSELRTYVFTMFVYLNGLDRFAAMYKMDLFIQCCTFIQEYLTKSTDPTKQLISFNPVVFLLENLYYIFIHPYEAEDETIDILSIYPLFSAYLSLLTVVQQLTDKQLSSPSAGLLQNMNLNTPGLNNSTVQLTAIYKSTTNLEVRNYVQMILYFLYYLNPTPVRLTVGRPQESAPQPREIDICSEKYQEVLQLSITVIDQLAAVLNRQRQPEDILFLLMKIIQKLVLIKKQITISEENAFMIEYYKLLDTVYGLQIKLIQDLLPVIQKKKTTRKWFKTDKMKQEEQNAINQEGFINSLLKLPKEKWEDRENIYVRLICSLGLNGLAIDIPKYDTICNEANDMQADIEKAVNSIDLDTVTMGQAISQSVPQLSKSEDECESSILKDLSRIWFKKNRTTQNDWDNLYYNISNDRGPWSDLTVQKDIIYKLSEHVDHKKQHKFLLKDPHGSRHERAILDSYALSSEESTEESDSSQKNIVNKFNALFTTTLSENELVTPTKHVTKKTSLLFSADVMVIKPFLEIPGKLELYSSYISFVLDEKAKEKFMEESEKAYQRRKGKGEKKSDLVDYSTFSIINLSMLKEEEFRTYLFQPTAVELFFKDGTSVFLTFESSARRTAFHEILRDLRLPNLQPFRGATVEERYRNSEATRLWLNHSISNFDYLMEINKIAGRSFNDLSQYYVFPWVLSNYTSETIDLTDPANYRDLAYPMQAQTAEKRHKIAERYDMSKMLYEDALHNPDENNMVLEPPAHYSTHYSCATYVSQFLGRLEPFCSYYIYVQDGHFDRPDRQFISIQGSYLSATQGTGDTRELIPEFYYLPEMYKNLNHYSLGYQQNTHEVINDVLLPPWAKTPEEFVLICREALESEYVSAHLHEWLDLIFGYKQMGEEAVKACNLYNYQNYYNSINYKELKEKDPISYERAITYCRECGQTPITVFTMPHKPRMPLALAPPMCLPLLSRNHYCSCSNAKYIGLYTRQDQSKNIFNEYHLVRSNSSLKMPAPVSTMIAFSDGVFTLLANRTCCLNPLKLIANEARYELLPDPLLQSKKSPKEFGQPYGWQFRSSAPSIAAHNLVYHSKNSDSPFVWSCGYWDKSFKYINVQTGESSLSIAHHIDVVTCICATEDGSYVVTGSNDSTVKVWQFNKNTNSIALFKTIYGHDNTVTNVSVNIFLDLLASASADGTIILSQLSQDLYIRTIPVYKNLSYDCLTPPEADPKGENKKTVYVDWMRVLNNGNILCYSQEDYTIRLYNSIGKLLQYTEVKYPLYALCLSLDTEYLLTGDDKGFLCTYRVSTLKEIRKETLRYGGESKPFFFPENPHFPSAIRSLSLSPNEGLLFVGLESGEIVTITSAHN